MCPTNTRLTFWMRSASITDLFANSSYWSVVFSLYTLLYTSNPSYTCFNAYTHTHTHMIHNMAICIKISLLKKEPHSFKGVYRPYITLQHKRRAQKWIGRKNAIAFLMFIGILIKRWLCDIICFKVVFIQILIEQFIENPCIPSILEAKANKKCCDAYLFVCMVMYVNVSPKCARISLRNILPFSI